MPLPRLHFVNNFKTVTTDDISWATTGIPVSSIAGIEIIPPGKMVPLTLISAADKTVMEVVYCIGAADGVVTVERAKEAIPPNEWAQSHEFPAGSSVECRIPAGALNSFAGPFDNGGDARGWGAVTLQSWRSNPDRVASGYSAVAIGNAKASGYGCIAVGDGADAESSSSVAIGPMSRAGAVGVAIGNQAKSMGDDPRVAVGNSAQALGAVSIAIGQSTIADSPQQVAIGSLYGGIDGRQSAASVFIQTRRRRAFDAARHVGGLEFIARGDVNSTPSGDPYTTAERATQEVMIYSVPVQLGDAGWQAATEYAMGQAITAGNGYSYVINSDITSGGTDPVWGTTVGSYTAEGGGHWVCHDLSFLPIAMPDWSRFVPLDVMVIPLHVTRGGAVVEPQISLGVLGDDDKWLEPTPLSDTLDAPGTVQILTPTRREMAKVFGFSVTPGEDLDMTALVVFRGIVIESLVE